MLPERNCKSLLSEQVWYRDDNSYMALESLLLKVAELIRHEILEKDLLFSGKAPTEISTIFKIDPTSKMACNLEADFLDTIRDLVHHSVNLSNPYSLAYMHSTPLKLSIIADFVASVINQSLDTWDQSPAATEVERALINYVGETAEIPIKSGWMTAGGTMSNHQGIILARDSKISQMLVRLGANSDSKTMQRIDILRRLRAFCSEEAHFSVEQGLHIAGFGSEALIKVPTNNDGTIDISILEDSLKKQSALESVPFLIVGTAGTTNVGAIDNLEKLGELAKKFSCWFHVDAAHGGACLFTKNYRGLIKGIELANSIAIDGHKFLYQPIPCGLFLITAHTDCKTSKSHGEVHYLNSSTILFENAFDSYHNTIQTSRPFDALKLYLCLKFLGKDFFSKLIESRIQITKVFYHMLRKEQDFEIPVEPSLNILIFRYKPSDLDEREIAYLNEQIWRELFISGDVLLSLTRHQGKRFLRAVIMNPLTKEDHLLEVITKIRCSAKKLLILLKQGSL